MKGIRRTPGESAPRPPKRFKPSATFGPCRKCGKERTAVHKCPLEPEIAALVRRALFDLRT
jgi:hypothetical protein